MSANMSLGDHLSSTRLGRWEVRGKEIDGTGIRDTSE